MWGSFYHLAKPVEALEIDKEDKENQVTDNLMQKFHLLEPYEKYCKQEFDEDFTSCIQDLPVKVNFAENILPEKELHVVSGAKMDIESTTLTKIVYAPPSTTISYIEFKPKKIENAFKLDPAPGQVSTRANAEVDDSLAVKRKRDSEKMKLSNKKKKRSRE